jgi:hypothetical protein
VGSSSRIHYLYDGGQPVAEVDNANQTLLAANAYGANGLLSRWSGGTATYYAFDPEGDVCQRLNSAGPVLSTDTYDAYVGTVQRAFARQFAQQEGVGEVVVYGAPRTTGANVGHTPRPIVIKVN